MILPKIWGKLWFEFVMTIQGLIFVGWQSQQGLVQPLGGCCLWRWFSKAPSEPRRQRQPKDQRYKAACLFAAACPETNKSAALVLPHANTEAMSLHLAEISTQVNDGAHAVVILDQAGGHTANDRDLPDNITLLFLPPYSPELNPIENLFQFLRHNFLNARVYDTYEDIVDACCWAWTSLLNIEGQLKSITTRAWAKTVNAWAAWY